MEPQDDIAELEALFLESVPGFSGGRVSLGPLLAQMLAQGRTAWPTLSIPTARFVAHVAATIEAGETDIENALRTRHADDLYLACGCALGLAAALEAFAVRHRSTIDMAVARIDAAPAFVDEVRQLLHERLFFDDERRSSRISSYRGHGPLAGWVAITAQRTALNLRESETAGQRAHQRASDEPWVPDLGPELQYLKQRYTAEFESAFVEALGKLGTRQRAVLGLRVASGLTLERIGLIYDVDVSTVSRWVGDAREELTSSTERSLCTRLGLSKTEMQSLARLVASQIDVSIARLLDADATAPPDQGPPSGPPTDRVR